MCLLLWHPWDAEPLTKEEFADFHQRNPHGFGMAWVGADNQLRYVKSMATVDQSWAEYEARRADGVTAMLLHWRLRTSGPTNAAQCHPFVAAGDTLVFHNGVLAWRHTAKLSDTQCFIADHLGPDLERRRNLRNHKWQRRLERKIGSGNKLALWRAGDKLPVLIGEHRGVWYRGRWMSNTYAWTVPAELKRPVTLKRAYTYTDGDWWDDDGWLPLLALTNKQRAYAELRKTVREERARDRS